MTDLQSVSAINGPANVNLSTNCYRYFVDCAGATVNLTLPLTKLNGMHLNILRNDSIQGAGATLNIFPNTGAQINRSGIGTPVNQPNLAEFEYFNIGNNWFYEINPGSTGATCQDFGNSATFGPTGGTFTVPPDGLCTLYIQMWAGGGGGGGPGAGGAGGGGGGGAFIADLLSNVPGGTSITFTIGLGGVGGPTAVDGVVGGNSSFTYNGNTRTARGGGGGPNGSGFNDGGAGGTATGGTPGITALCNGSKGGDSNTNTNGGPSPNGGAGGIFPSGNGGIPGGGAAGGSLIITTGGNGGDGRVIVRY